MTGVWPHDFCVLRPGVLCVIGPSGRNVILRETAPQREGPLIYLRCYRLLQEKCA